MECDVRVGVSRSGKGAGFGRARHFALRSLDRLLSKGWNAERRMKHVIAYSDPKAEPRDAGVPGVLDDYAFTVIACLDAYEATADFSYFRLQDPLRMRCCGIFRSGSGRIF